VKHFTLIFSFLEKTTVHLFSRDSEAKLKKKKKITKHVRKKRKLQIIIFHPFFHLLKFDFFMFIKIENLLANASFCFLFLSMIFFWLEAILFVPDLSPTVTPTSVLFRSNFFYSHPLNLEEIKYEKENASNSSQVAIIESKPNIFLKFFLDFFKKISLENFAFGNIVLAQVSLISLLILRWIESGHFPLSNLYESLMFLSWSFTFLYLFLDNKIFGKYYEMPSVPFLGAIISPCALFTNAFASFSLPEEMQKSSALVPALQSNWLMMHVTVMILSYTALILGSLLSIAFLILINGTKAFSFFFLRPKSLLFDSSLAPTSFTSSALLGFLPFPFPRGKGNGKGRNEMGCFAREMGEKTENEKTIRKAEQVSQQNQILFPYLFAKSAHSMNFNQITPRKFYAKKPLRPIDKLRRRDLEKENQFFLSKIKKFPAKFTKENLVRSSLKNKSFEKNNSFFLNSSLPFAFPFPLSLPMAFPASLPSFLAYGVSLPISLPSGKWEGKWEGMKWVASQGKEQNGLLHKGNATNLLQLAKRLDQLSYRILGIGFPLLTIGILSGAVWANEAWGSYWSWDPKETWALLTWLVFAIYLHTRLNNGWKGEKPAMIASFGFLIVWICYLGVNLLGEGLHSYGWFNF